MPEFLDQTAWDPELPTEFAVERVENLISERTGIITRLGRSHKMTDLPRLYQYGAAITPINVISEVSVGAESGAGTSFLPLRAKIKAIGEAFDRYCEAIYSTRAFTWDYRERLSKRARCLDLSNVSRIQAEELPETLEKQALHWIRGYGMYDHLPCFVPAQLVYVPYRFQKDELLLRSPISTGVAAGTSYGGALLRATLEIVEREAFMLTYLHSHHPPAIDLTEIGHPLMKVALESLAFCKLELRVVDITIDVGVPVALSILTDRTGRYPAVNLGAKAALNIKDAVVGAVEEAFHTLAWGRSILAQRLKDIEKVRSAPLEVSSLEDRLLYWGSPDSLSELSFLMENSEETPIPPSQQIAESPREQLQRLISTFRSNGMDLYALDLTTADVETCGFKVVRVISPQAVPLYLDERWRCWNSKRLFEVPKKLGWSEAKATVEDLAQQPHPFL